MKAARWLRSALTRRPAPKAPAHRLSVEFLEARDNPSGGLLDPTFGNGGIVLSATAASSRALTDVTVLPDGKIVAAGYVTAANGASDFAAARYNPDGTPDSSFGTGGLASVDFKNGTDQAMAAAVQPGTGGKVLLAGTVQTSAGQVFGVVRLNTNGTLDTTFGDKSSKGKVTLAPDARYANRVSDMVVYPDGRFVLVGVTLNDPVTTARTSISLARFNANGTPDTTFGNSGKVVSTIVSAGLIGFNSLGHPVNVVLDGSGRLVVSGSTAENAQTGDRGDFLIARFGANGSLDTTFGAGQGVVTTDLETGGSGYDMARAMTLQGDGKIVVAGFTTSDLAGTHVGTGVVRYNPDGSLDTTFDGDGIASVYLGDYDLTTSAVAVQPDGKLLLAQTGSWLVPNAAGGYDTTAALWLVRLDADGTRDLSYGPSGTGAAGALLYHGVSGDYNSAATSAMALQADGRPVLVGNQRDPNTLRFSLALTRFTASSAASSPVQVGAFSSSAASATAGDSVTLTAGNITDANAGATVTKVAFYYFDSSGTEQFLGYGTKKADGTWTLTFTVALAPGSYTLLALATDSAGTVSDPLSLSLQVV